MANGKPDKSKSLESWIWDAACSIRGAKDAPKYKHVVLGLIFLKYISDTAGKCRMAKAEVRTRNARPIRHSKFIVRNFPWSHLQANAKQPTIGKTVDDAMVAIERDWQMANAEVRMTNRSRFTSKFEIQQSKFA